MSSCSTARINATGFPCFLIASAKRFLKEKQDSIALASEDLKTCQEEFNIAKQKMNEAKNRYNKAINYTMEEWEENNRQLKLFPEEPEA